MWQIILPSSLLKFTVTIFILKKVFPILINYYQWWTHPIWSDPKIGGPEKNRFSSSFWMGRFVTLAKEPFIQPQLRWFKEASESGCNPNIIHYCFLLGRHTLMLRDAHIINQVLSARGNEFPKRQPVLKNILGKSLLGSDGGEDWKRHRRIVQPCFQMQNLKESLSQAVPPVVKNLMECWKRAGDASEIDISVHLSHCTLDILGITAFAHDFKAMNSIQKWSREVNGDTDEKILIDPVSDPLMKSLSSMFNSLFRTIGLGFFGLSRFDVTANKCIEALNIAADDIIDNARKRTATVESDVPQSENKETLKKSPKSLLETLIEAMDGETNKRKRLDQEELRDELKTFLVAGHETTSTWCTWCCFALCQHPSIQQKVYDDINKHVSSNNQTDPIPLENIEKMSYFNAFLNEVLRFHPPVGIFFRENDKDYTFNGTTIPANTRVAITPYFLHRNPTYWNTHDPEEFYPERWLGDEFPATTTQAFIPFSSGPRTCIGHMFATLEAKMIMVELIRSFQFRLSPSQRDTEFTLTQGATTKPYPNVMVCVRPRI